MPRPSLRVYKIILLRTGLPSLAWSTRPTGSEVSAPAVGVTIVSDNIAMPDLQYAAARDDTMVKIRDHLLPMRRKCPWLDLTSCRSQPTDSELKKYKLSTAPGPDLTQSIGPSAEFLQTPIAFNYRWVQCLQSLRYTKSFPVSSRISTSNTQRKVWSICRRDSHIPRISLSNRPWKPSQLGRIPAYPPSQHLHPICKQ
jgi:hypothetical protein